MWSLIFRYCCLSTLARLSSKEAIQCLSFLLAKAQADKENLDSLSQTLLSQQVTQGPVSTQSPASSQACILALTLTRHIVPPSLSYSIC